jgi:hypothetical protein
MRREKSMQGENIPFRLRKRRAFIEPGIVQQIVSGQFGAHHGGVWQLRFVGFFAHAIFLTAPLRCGLCA